MNRQRNVKPMLLGVGVSLFFALGWGLPVLVYLPLAFVSAGVLSLVLMNSAIFNGGARTGSADHCCRSSPGGRAMNPRSVRAGAVAAVALGLFYVVVLRGASGSWAHLTDQVRQDWYYLVPIMAGLGVQVALVSELRQRHRLHHGVAAASGVGAGASTAGMIACCAHHLAALPPFIGAAGAAGFLTDRRIPVMVLGIGVNTVGVTVAARRLHRTPPVPGHQREQVQACAA